MKMDAVKFLKEMKRMCDSFDDYCNGCQISQRAGLFACSDFQYNHPEQSVAIVEEWSEEHPQETRLSRFLKYYPNALMDDDGTPEVCVNELGIKRDDGCTTCNCIKCWNTPIEEE
jgi:hypothetical protein